MVKKIRLLGMEIDNFPLQEEVLQGEGFYDQNELNIIRTISLKTLSMAAASQTVREGIALADLLVVGDKEILMEAWIYSGQRLRAAAEQGFMKEYLRRMCDNRRKVFLVAQDLTGLEDLQEFLQAAYENMDIVGTYPLESCGGEYDIMVNEINAVLPDIVLSVLDPPWEDECLLEEKAKISAKVWYSLGGAYQPEQKLSFVMRFQKFIHRGKFKNVIHQYEESNEWDK